MKNQATPLRAVAPGLAGEALDLERQKTWDLAAL
jgi:hypothetical protein